LSLLAYCKDKSGTRFGPSTQAFFHARLKSQLKFLKSSALLIKSNWNPEVR